MASLLPLVTGAPADQIGINDTSKLYREIQWDSRNNCPVWRAGNPVWVTGADAVASWVMMTLHTVRGSKDIFSGDYGCDLQHLAGQPFSETVRQSEAVRYVKECLQINPYITDVRQIKCDFSNDTVSISCTVSTVYGEVSASVA